MSNKRKINEILYNSLKEAGYDEIAKKLKKECNVLIN